MSQMSSQARFQQIYREKARMEGGLSTGGKRRKIAHRGGTSANKRAEKKNPWLKFVKQYWRAHPGLSYKEALQGAAPAYRRAGY